METDRANAGKNFIHVLQLLKTHTIDDVIAAVQTAKLRGTNDPNAIVLILTQRSIHTPIGDPLNLNPQLSGVKRPVVDLSGYSLKALGECA